MIIGMTRFLPLWAWLSCDSDHLNKIFVHPKEYQNKMSFVMRKTAFFICENKAADQLHSNNTTDQRPRFPYIDNTLHLHVLFKSKISSL